MSEIIEEQVLYDNTGMLILGYKCTCGAELKETHIDDVNTRWFKCTNEECGLIFRHKASEWFIKVLEAENYLKTEITLEELDRVISKTIFEDYPVKILLFLVCLLSYTEEDQINAIISGESSVGKTYGLNEILWFMSQDSVLRFEGATPKSFIHKQEAKQVDVRDMSVIDYAEAPKEGDSQEDFSRWYDKLRHSAYFLNYERKLIVFPDMPDSRLLENLRPILSHDRKISTYDVAEKGQKGLRTKTVLIQGFFTSIFASASTKLDEQETSRHFLLSPTDDPKKIMAAINLIARKNSDPLFKKWYEEDKDRVLLRYRVNQISDAQIKLILLPEGLIQTLKDWYLNKITNLCPKTQRDFPRLVSLAKAWALLNYRTRVYEDGILWCNETDVEIAKKLYEPILASNELGLSPEEYDLWSLIKDRCFSEIEGLPIKEVHMLYYEKKKRSMSDKRLRGILMNFCRAGLLREEKDGNKIRYCAIVRKEDEKIQQRLDVGVEQPKTQKDKNTAVIELLRDIPVSVAEITHHLNDSGVKITEQEVNIIILKLSHAGRVYEPETGRYQLVS